MNKAYRFRIYPNKNQEVNLIRTLDTCRHLYNNALSERKQQAEQNRLYAYYQVFPWGKPEWISYEDQANDLTDSKTEYQKEVHSQVLQNSLKRLDRSFKNLFIGFGYPRFKGRNRYNSFTYPQSGFELIDDKLVLSKIGTVKIVLHRELKGFIKTCKVPKDLSVRIHICHECGLIMNRDCVSAILIENKPSTVGITGIKACLSNLNREPMKQEATLLMGW